MDTILIIIAVILIVTFFAALSKNKEQFSKSNSSNNYNYDRDLTRDFYSDRKYKLQVMPTVFTSLKALKLRGKVFDSQEEINKLDLKQSEAYSATYMPDYDTQRIENAWTDGGNASNEKQLEDYYIFLEKLRSIFENKTTSAEDRFQNIIKLCKESDQYKKYFNNLNEYYKAFPACLFYKDLTKVDGIGDGTAFTLFNSGIKTLKELKNATDEELNEIPGIGKKTIQQIRNYFKSQIELDDDISTKTDIVNHETELLKTPIQSEGIEKWNERDTTKGIVPDAHSFGVRRSVIQILETTAIMSSSKNIDTILGRADFLRERFAEIVRAVKTPQYSSDLQYALDEYRSTYYNTDIKGWQMGIFTKPEEFDLDKFCAECLFEGFMRHYAHQKEQISNLKRESAIKNRYKKLHETFIKFLEEFDKERNSITANDFKNYKLEKLKNIESTLISNKS